MRIAVCDDEKQQRNLIKRLLRNSAHFNQFIKIDEYSSGDDLVSAICENGNQYDVIFLDIAMHGMNGIETARIIRQNKNNCIILFITGLIDYVLQAFEVKAFRYLIKPVSQQKFDKEFAGVLSELHNFEGQNFVISCNHQIITLKTMDMLYLEINLRRITAYTITDSYTFYGKFADQVNKLSDWGFVPVNRGILVNLAHIKQINKTDLYLKSGKAIPISRNRRKDVYDQFTRHMMENSL